MKQYTIGLIGLIILFTVLSCENPITNNIEVIDEDSGVITYDLNWFVIAYSDSIYHNYWHLSGQSQNTFAPTPIYATEYICDILKLHIYNDRIILEYSIDVEDYMSMYKIDYPSFHDVYYSIKE